MDSLLIDCDFMAAKEAAARQCRYMAVAEADALLSAAGARTDRHAVNMEKLYATMSKAQRKRVTTEVLSSPWHVAGVTNEESVCAYLQEWESLGSEALRMRLAEMLTISASRTGWQERYQFSCLESGSALVYGLVDLPAGGDGALFLDGTGHITTDRAKSLAKSIDFVGRCRVSETREVKVTIAAKYTEIDGGAQDNQTRDLLHFAQTAMDVATARNDADNAVIVMLLCDGEYYGKRHANLGLPGVVAFRDEVRQKYHEKLVGCTDISHFDVELERIISKLA